MMHCSHVYLDTGDNVIGMTDSSDVNYSDYTMTIVNPVKLETIRTHDPETGRVSEIYMMKLLAPFSVSAQIELQTSKVIFMSDINVKYEKAYHDYLLARKLKDKMEEIEETLKVRNPSYSNTPDAEENPEEQEEYEREPDSPTYH